MFFYSTEHPSMHKRATQTGAAIIMALFVVSLVAAAATAMMLRLSMDVRRATLIQNYGAARTLASGSVLWAIDQLQNDYKTHTANSQTLIDKLPIVSPSNTVNGFTITSVIQDAQYGFNLNTLSATNAANFLLLLKAVQPDIELETAQQITNSIITWVSDNKEVTDAKYYAELKPGYSMPHRPMASISELRLIRGVTPKLYDALLPLVTALPVNATAININSAQAPVLMSLDPKITFRIAQAILAYRKAHPFITLDQFSQLDMVKNNGISAANLTVTSNYFLLATNVTVGEQKINLFTLLTRILKNNKPIVVILWQTNGTL